MNQVIWGCVWPATRQFSSKVCPSAREEEEDSIRTGGITTEDAEEKKGPGWCPVARLPNFLSGQEEACHKLPGHLLCGPPELVGMDTMMDVSSRLAPSFT